MPKIPKSSNYTAQSESGGSSDNHYPLKKRKESIWSSIANFRIRDLD